jgi:fumarate reductase flavoprotein subunit
MASAEKRDAGELIVVGAGVGGLTAAVTLADRGHWVIVVETSKELGGGAGCEPEAIAAAGTRTQHEAGIVDDAARLVADVMAAVGEGADRALVEAAAEQGPRLIDWLADRCGLGMTLLGDTSQAGHAVRRLHYCGEHGGEDLRAALARAATRRRRVHLRAGVTVTELRRDETGKVIGVLLPPDRRGPQLLSGRVLLAGGGFAGSDELVAQHCPEVAGLPHLAGSPADGSSLRLGLSAGAATRNLSACTVAPLLALPGNLQVPIRMIDMGALLVNQLGVRFTDERGTDLDVARAIRAQPGGVAYLLFDERIKAATSADPFFAKVLLARAARQAEGPTGLARQFEIAVDGLRTTIEAAAFESPLQVIRVTGARRRTLGGLPVDTRARVLDAAGIAIPGLYAAGDAAAVIGGEHPQKTPEGVHALATLAYGRIAALDVAAEAEQGDEAERAE